MELLKAYLPLLTIVFYMIYNSYIKNNIVEPKNHFLLYLYKMLVMTPFVVTSYVIHTKSDFNVFLFWLIVGAVLGYIKIFYVINNKSLFPVKEIQGFGFSDLWRYFVLLGGLYVTITFVTNIYLYSGLIFLLSLGFYHTRYIHKALISDIDFLEDDDDEKDIDYEKMSNIVEKFIADNPGIEVKNPYKDKIDDGSIFEFEFKITK